MKYWRCKACGQVIEDTMGKGVPPKEHGVIIVAFCPTHLRVKNRHEVCRGTLEVIPGEWDENIRRLENAG